MRGSNRFRGFSDSIVGAVVSGVLLGTGSFFLKITMSGVISRMLIFSPIAWIALILMTTGFLFMQKSLQGYVSKAIPIINGFFIFVSVMLAFFFLGEAISALKWLGIFLVLAGVFGLLK